MATENIFEKHLIIALKFFDNSFLVMYIASKKGCPVYSQKRENI
jgi:hypothetical protein